MATTPPNDLGIVLFAEHSGDGNTFTKASGQAGTPKTLTNGNFIVSDSFYCGAAGRIVVTVGGAISAGMASAVVILEGQRTDVNNPSVPQWAVIPTVRDDQPAAAPAASQTILRADLAGQSVDAGSGAATEVLDVRLLSTDTPLSGVCRVIVKATNAPQAGDKVIVSVNAGGVL